MTGGTRFLPIAPVGPGGPWGPVLPSIPWSSFSPSWPSFSSRPGIQGVPGMPDTQLQGDVDFFTKGTMIQVNVVSLKGAREEKGVVLSCLTKKASFSLV